VLNEAVQEQAAGRALTRAQRVRLVVILGGLMAFAPASIDMYLPAFPAIARDLGSQEAQVQLTLTSCLFGLALGQALAGPISDALGRRPPLLVGLACYTTASLLCAVAPSVYALAGLRLLQGVAGAAGTVIAGATVRDLYAGPAAGRFFSRLMLVQGMAPVLAPVIGGQLLRVGSWRALFLVLAAMGLLLIPAVLFGLRETLPPERRRRGSLPDTARTFGRLLRERGFMSYAVSGGLGFAAMFAYISSSPFVLQDLYGVSPQGFSVVFGANALGLVVVSQVNAHLVGRVPMRTLLGIGLGGIATGGVALLAVVVAGMGLAGIVPALFLTVASIGLTLPNSTALALSAHPDAAGAAAALLGVTQLTLGALAAPLTGIGGGRTAVPAAAVIATLGVSALLALLTLGRNAPNPAPGRRQGAA
jgi:DHA1 family bicyclomycin/chloramphenicol resistance-like MFS transporter